MNILKNKKIIFILSLFIIFISITYISVSATDIPFGTRDLKGIDTSEIKKFSGTIYAIIRNITIISSVVILSFIGLKTITGSVEQKAEYKKSLIPLIIGVLIVNLSITIVESVADISQNVSSTEISSQIRDVKEQVKYDVWNRGVGSWTTVFRNVASRIFSYISWISFGLVAVFTAVIGLKLITGSPSERAEYKKTFMPLIVGALIVALSSTVINILWNSANQIK